MTRVIKDKPQKHTGVQESAVKHSNASDTHWSQKKEHGNIFAIKSLLFFYRYLGRWVLMVLLYPIVFFYFIIAKDARLASRQYLEKMYAAHPEAFKGKKPSISTQFNHFYQFALAAIDKIDAWIGRIDINKVTVFGQQHFERLTNSKQGAVFISSHLGNIELCRALSKKRTHIRINALVFTKHALKFNQVLKEINPEVDLNMIQVSDVSPDLAIILKERIEQGEFVVIVGDRTSTTQPDKVAWCQFLGEPAPFAIGPFILAYLMECPTYFISCTKLKRNFQLHFEPLAEHGMQLPRKERSQHLQNYIQTYATKLEKYCKEAPLQWFNFFDFWSIPQKKEPNNTRKEK